MFFTEWGPGSTSEMVVEKERSVRKTGVLDVSGNPIYAVEETAPVGFVRFAERKS
jgi:hypothetical protein